MKMNRLERATLVVIDTIDIGRGDKLCSDGYSRYMWTGTRGRSNNPRMTICNDDGAGSKES